MCCLPTIYTSTTPKARKRHRCCECDGFIERGERYHLDTGLWDGCWKTFHTCPECHLLREDVDRTVDYDEERSPFGHLCYAVFELRDNADWIRRYMHTRNRRHAPLSRGGWMERAEAELPKFPIITIPQP